MYIVNAAGVTHSIPDEWKLPTGARKATDAEIAAYEAPTTKPTTAAPTAAPSLELVSAVAEKDARIAELEAKLAEAAKTGKKANAQ